MFNPETLVWSSMTGVLLTVAAVATVNMLVHRNKNAVRGWLSAVLTASACIILTCVPAAVWPSWRELHLLPLQAVLGPLCGALLLSYLGYWSGVGRDDRLVCWLMGPGAILVAIGAWGLLLWTFMGGTADRILPATFLVNSAAVLMGGLVAVRSVTLGDQLARWMVLACVSLAQMTAGLYAKVLALSMPMGYWILTAVAAVVFFLAAAFLVHVRYLMARRLLRQALGHALPGDPVALPRGSQLVQQVDDAIWRSARMERPCVVAAIVLPNLYAHGQVAAAEAEADILLRLAARIRQVVGFRNVVGLLHQRCFVLAVSAVQDPQRGKLVSSRLLQELRMSVPLAADPLALPFQPDLGVGVVEVPSDARGVEALPVLNLAEQLALEACWLPERVRHVVWRSQPAPAMALFPAAAETAPMPLVG